MDLLSALLYLLIHLVVIAAPFVRRSVAAVASFQSNDFFHGDHSPLLTGS